MKKNVKTIGFIFMLFICSIFLSVVANSYGNNQFWNFNIITLLTLNVTIFFSFYIVQRINSNRRKEDFIIKSINELEDILHSRKIRDTENSNSIKKARLMQRTIATRLEIIKGIAPNCIMNELKKSGDIFNEYKELFDNNYSNKDMMESKEEEFDRIENVLVNIFFEIKVDLYKKMM